MAKGFALPRISPTPNLVLKKERKLAVDAEQVHNSGYRTFRP